MDIDLLKQIVDYIRELAEPMVTAGYEMVLRQVQFKMIYNIVICVGLIVVFYGGVWCIRKGIAWQKESEYSMYEMWYTAGVITTIFSVVIFFSLLYSILNTLINPDWVAIQTIMRLVEAN